MSVCALFQCGLAVGHGPASHPLQSSCLDCGMDVADSRRPPADDCAAAHHHPPIPRPSRLILIRLFVPQRTMPPACLGPLSPGPPFPLSGWGWGQSRRLKNRGNAISQNFSAYHNRNRFAQTSTVYDIINETENNRTRQSHLPRHVCIDTPPILAYARVSSSEKARGARGGD